MASYPTVPLSPTILSIRCECVLQALDTPTPTTLHTRRMLRSISKDLHNADQNMFDPHLKNRIDEALLSLNSGNIANAKTIVQSIANLMVTP